MRSVDKFGISGNGDGGREVPQRRPKIEIIMAMEQGGQ